MWSTAPAIPRPLSRYRSWTALATSAVVPISRPAGAPGQTVPQHFHRERQRLEIVRRIIDRRRRSGRRRIEIIVMAISDISADFRGPGCAREIRRVDVPSIGVVYRRNVALPEDNARVESVGEPLQYSSRSRI